MELLQTYETTISDNNGQWALTYLVVPKRSADLHALPLYGPDVQPQLDLLPMATLSVSQLPSAIASLLVAHEKGGDAFALFQSAAKSPLQEPYKASYPAALAFAEQACFLDLVPFEQSPLHSEALATLLTKASGVGIGAYIGWVISAGTPLLLVTVPAGMIICGAAAGAAHGLEAGLRTRISQWIAGKNNVKINSVHKNAESNIQKPRARAKR